MKENSSLCFSNNDLHTFSYNEYVKKSFRLCSLSSNTLEAGAFYTPRQNRLMNHYNEYWYIGSIVDRSIMQKNNRDALNATDLYDSLASSIYASVILESLTLWLISAANFFEFCNLLISVSSINISEISPFVSDKDLRIESSILTNSFLS